MKILLLCGSVAKRSHTHALLRFIEELLKKQKVETVFWDLHEKPLIIAIPEYHHDPSETPNEIVRQFVSVVDSADGIILGSPLYHGSYSGVLKNALDCLSLDGFRNKVVGLVSNGSGPRSSYGAVEHLRLVVRALRGYATQIHIHTNNSDYDESEKEFVLQSGDIQKRCEDLVHELLLLVAALKGKKTIQG